MSRRQRSNNSSNKGSNRSNNANNHLIGTEVHVIQKEDQRTGKLTKGTISEILTNMPSHPRGIKVRLTDGTVGRIASAPSLANDSITTTTIALSSSIPSSAMLDRFDDEHRRTTPTIADFITLPSPVPQPLDSTEQTSWNCTKCTFLNSGLLANCEICEAAR